MPTIFNYHLQMTHKKVTYYLFILFVLFLIFSIQALPVLALVYTADYDRTLTTSGNEITDVTRTTNTQGDGITPPDSSYGIWQATTNLVTNGGFESNTTGWSAAGTASIERSTNQVKFGSQSLRVQIASGTVGTARKTFTYSATTTYSLSVWVYIIATGGASSIHMDANPTGGAAISVNADMTKLNQWQKLTSTFTTTSSVGGTYIDFIRVDGAALSGTDVYIDGAQAEVSALATPYVETNGATAARSAARVQAPASLVSTTQSWVAARVRYGYASTALPSSNPYIFDFRDNANNLLGLYFDTSTNKWTVARTNGGTGSTAVSAAQTFSKSDAATVIASFTGSQIKVSVNGGAFVATSDTNIPTLTAANFDIASQGGSSQFDGDVFWFVAGSGTLTDADASTLNGFGNSDPGFGNLSSLASTAKPTVFWDGATSTYTYRQYDAYQPDPQPPVTPTPAPVCNGQAAPGSAPNLFEIDPFSTSVKLNFTPVNPVTGYWVSYGTDPNNLSLGASYGGSTQGVQTITIGSLNPGTKYYFQVRGGNECSAGPWSQVVGSTTLLTGESPTPTITTSFPTSQTGTAPTPTSSEPVPTTPTEIQTPPTIPPEETPASAQPQESTPSSKPNIISQTISAIASAVKQSLSFVGNGIKIATSAIGDGLLAMTNTAEQGLAFIGNTVGNGIAFVFDRTGQGLTSASSVIASGSEAISNTGKIATSAIGNGLVAMTGNIGHGFDSLAVNTPGAAKNIAVALGSGVTGAGATIGNGFSAVGTTTHNIADSTGKTIGTVSNSTGNRAGATTNAVGTATDNTVRAITRTTTNVTDQTSRSALASRYARRIIDTTKSGIGSLAFAVGERTENGSGTVGAAIIEFGYLFIPDPTKIYDVKVANSTPTSMTITWATNHPASSKVNWGLTADYGQDVQSGKRVTNHEITVTGLKPSTAYFYEVMSQNKNYVYDARHEFTTSGK